MITTKDVRIKRRGQEKVGILTSNVVKPKGFKTKGKPARRSPEIITTSNIKEYQGMRKKDLVKENRAAKIRQKKLDENTKTQQEKKRLEGLKKEKTIEGQIEALEQKKKELEAKLRGERK